MVKGIIKAFQSEVFFIFDVNISNWMQPISQPGKVLWCYLFYQPLGLEFWLPWLFFTIIISYSSGKSMTYYFKASFSVFTKLRNLHSLPFVWIHFHTTIEIKFHVVASMARWDFFLLKSEISPPEAYYKTLKTVVDRDRHYGNLLEIPIGSGKG